MKDMFEENIYASRIGVYHAGSRIESLGNLALLHDKKYAENSHQENTHFNSQPVTAEKAGLFSC